MPLRKCGARRWAFQNLVLFLGFASLSSFQQFPTNNPFRIEKGFLKMSDGVSLAATYYLPVSENTADKFPVLLELLPYRKDDFFYLRDYPLYSYFAKRGFITVKVDIRGTGSSEGRVPDREYSDIELNDAVELIDQLSKRPDSNGRVGMWGISWGGFNALQVRSLKPPALKAILALHTSDDLYHDDVHYIDGIMHMDPYAIGVEVTTIFPRSPDYPLDKSYFTDRFDSYPWILGYLKHQRDGKFWREKSRRFETLENDIPVYMIGGHLDGYRDTVIRTLEKENAVVQAEIGPWNHDFPDVGMPGPNYEWRARAVDWWNRWLREDRHEKPAKSLIAFIRAPAISEKEKQPGEWKQIDFKTQDFLSLYPQENSNLGHDVKAGETVIDYHPGQGSAVGNWWGEVTGDMSVDDKLCTVFDSAPRTKTIEMAGFAEVKLDFSSSMPLAHFVARLEDVFPDGKTTLVAGGALNSSQREDRLNPKPMVKDHREVLEFPLHYSTWVFKPEHRIRLSLCHGQFPMFWPTPHLGKTEIHLGAKSQIRIPLLSNGKLVTLPPPEPREAQLNAKSLADEAIELKVIRDEKNKSTQVVRLEKDIFEIDHRNYFYSALTKSTVTDAHPELAEFYGEMNGELNDGPRHLHVKTEFQLLSDTTNFHANLTRYIYENGKLKRKRKWQEVIPRDGQ